MQEKINEEFVKKSWDIDYEAEKEEYLKEIMNLKQELIAKAICRKDLKEIKEIIEDLENEIGTL